MTRRAIQRQNLSIALFPFLAVLICTMGVIIVMLVIVVRQASARAAADVAAAEAAARKVAATPAGPSSEETQQHEQALQDLAWEREVLAQQRDERVEELARLRQSLAHVEDHLRRLQEQAKALLAQAQAIDEGKKLSNPELEAARAALAQKQKEIDLAKAEVEKLKQERSAKERWFALIPYDGPNGTRRRPVYIECSEAGIVLQPEGIALLPDDFNGPLGPGNPLDAALKAKREYLERNGEKGLPYPLLIVRPDGIVAYMVARSALKSWEEEFGYELLDAERKLTYGQPDPALAQTIAQSVRQARQRQAVMVASMPRRYQAEDQLSSFNTNEAMSRQPEMEMTGRSVGRSSSPTGGVGGDPRTGGVGSGGTGQGGLGSGSGISYAAGGPNGGGGQAGSGGANALRPAGANGYGNSAGGPNGFAASNGAGNRNGSSAGGSGPANGNPTSGGNSSAGNAAGGAGGPNANGSASPSGGGSQWSNATGGGGQSGGGSPGGSSSSGASSGGQSVQLGSSGNSASRGGQAPKPGQPTGSSRMGQNWGLLDTHGRTVAVARPIRVRLQKNQIALLPDVGDAGTPTVIPLQNDDLSNAEIETFVQAVQHEIEGWGVAAENGYWRPQLSFDVSSTAEARFQQWEQALNGSGYELKRKYR